MNHGRKGKRTPRLPRISRWGASPKRWRTLKVLILNFAHPLTAAHYQSVLAATKADPGKSEVRDIKCQADVEQPFADQAARLVEAARLTSDEWQTEALVIVPPALAPLSLAVMAVVCGRAGYLPAVVRLKPVQGSVPPRFEFAEVMNLQALRDASRSLR